MNVARMTRLGLRMTATAYNIMKALEDHPEIPEARRKYLLEIAEMLEEADLLLHQSRNYCDHLAHLVLTYKKDSDISKHHIEQLINENHSGY